MASLKVSWVALKPVLGKEGSEYSSGVRESPNPRPASSLSSGTVQEFRCPDPKVKDPTPEKGLAEEVVEDTSSSNSGRAISLA
jgi:hypothetical protein